MAGTVSTGPLPVARPAPVSRPGTAVRSAVPAPRRNPRRTGAIDRMKAEADKAKADAERAASEAAARVAEAKAKGASAESAARAAEAQARAAEARARSEAAASEAAAKRTAAETKAREDATARSREAMPWQIAASAAAVPAGIAAGAHIAKGIDARHTATMAARNKEIAALGKSAEALVKKVPEKGKLSRTLAAKLGGVVATADKLNLGKMRGPSGLVPAALLLAEGAVVRFGVAPQIKDERARAVAGGVASASVFAATNLIGERMVQNATPKALPSAKTLASIETARNLVGQPAAQAATRAASSSAGATALRVGGKVLSRGLPVLAAGLAAVAVVQGYRKDGVKGAAMAGADFLTFGLVSAGAAYLNTDAAKKAAAPAPRTQGGRRAAQMRNGGWRKGRGFANKQVQAAAQAARRRSGS